MGSPRPSGASTEAEDGLPFFSTVGMAPGSPAGLDAGQGTDGPGLSSPTNGAPSISAELSFSSFIEGAGRGFRAGRGHSPSGGSQQGRCDVRWGGRGL